MRVTPEQLGSILAKPGYGVAGVARVVPAHGEASGSQPERDLQAGNLGQAPAQTRDSAFYAVRVTSYRVRLLDTDNLVCKWHVDALRYAGILPSDAPDHCQITVAQKKVKTGADERTDITIERIG